MLFFDSSVWIDYFTGQPWARKVKPLIDGDDAIFISSVNLVEILSKYYLRSGVEAEQIKRILLGRCRIIDVTKEIALQAAQLKATHSLALADSIILATARASNATLFTMDSDFEGLQGVRVLKRR